MGESVTLALILLELFYKVLKIFPRLSIQRA
jgi:hypothetical protein